MTKRFEIDHDRSARGEYTNDPAALPVQLYRKPPGGTPHVPNTESSTIMAWHNGWNEGWKAHQDVSAALGESKPTPPRTDLDDAYEAGFDSGFNTAYLLIKDTLDAHKKCPPFKRLPVDKAVARVRDRLYDHPAPWAELSEAHKKDWRDAIRAMSGVIAWEDI